MVAYRRLSAHYRLAELGFALPEGLHILPAATFAPVAEATQLVADARARAEEIVEEARTERENERRRGFEEGLLEGRLRAARETLRQSADLDARLQALERELSAIVLASMRKLVDGFDADARAMAVVRGALKQMRREKKAELRISSEQVGYFRARVSAILAEFPGFELIEVVEDASLSVPRVVVETSIGRVEGDLGSRLDELAGIVREIASGILVAPVGDGDGKHEGGADER